MAWQRVAGRGRAWCGGCSLFLASRRARDHPPPSPPTHPPCIVRVHAAAASCVFARACSCGACAVRCSAVRCGRCGLAGAVRCGAVRCGAVRCGVVGPAGACRRMRGGAVCGDLVCGAVRCGVVWCGGCAVGGVYRFLFPCGSLSPVASSKRAARCARGAQGRVGRRPCDAIPPGLNRGAGLVPGMQVAGGRGAAASSTGRPGEAGVKEAKRAREEPFFRQSQSLKRRFTTKCFGKVSVYKITRPDF